jgi:hypothetical protein
VVEGMARRSTRGAPTWTPNAAAGPSIGSSLPPTTRWTRHYWITW